MRALLAFGVILAALAPFGARAASCPVPYTFTYGTPADASQVNANFMALQTCIAAGGGGAPPGGGLYSTQYNLNTMFGGSGPGLAGQVLTSNGPSLPPSFQAPGAASVSITGGDSSIVASPSPITGTGTITVGGPSHLTTFSAGTLPMGAGASPLTASEITDVGLSGVIVGSPTGGAMGAGTINMTGCFVNGSSCAGSGSTTITLGVGLSNAASGSYNTGVQTVTNGSTIYPQLYYVAHSTSYTVAATDGAALATFTASGQTATLPAVGAVGSRGFVFGYDGTHSYTVSGTGIYGACGSPPYAFQTQFIPDGTNWQCIPSGAGGGGVNAGTTPQITYYAASGSTVSGDAHLSDQFASTGTLEYNLNSGAIPAQSNGIHITGPAASSARYSADAYGGSLVTMGTRSDGTQASPTAVAGTEPLSSLQASAYDGTTTHIGTPQIEFNLSTSTSTQSTGNHGSQFDWYTTPDGTTTLTHQFTMGSDGGLFNPTATGGDKGVGTINLASGCFVNGTSCSGTAAFSALTGGTNTAAAMVVGSGATLAASGSGTITATTVPLAGITGLGTGVATALGDNVGSAGAVLVNGGALGTPSSGTLTNATGLPTAGLLNSAVTYAKIQNETASTLLGNPTGSAAAPSEITLGTNLSFSGGVLNAAGGGGSVSVTAGTPNVVVTPSPGTGTFTVGTTGPFNSQSGSSYSVVAGDLTKLIEMTSGSATTVALPQNTTSGFGTGAEIGFYGTQAGIVVTPGGGLLCGLTSMTLGVGQYLGVAGAATGNYDCDIGMPASGSQGLFLATPTGSSGQYLGRAIVGTDLTAALASPPDIGLTTPGQAKVTNLTVTGTCTGCSGGGSGGTNANLLDNGDMYVDQRNEVNVGSTGSGGLTSSGLGPDRWSTLASLTTAAYSFGRSTSHVPIVTTGTYQSNAPEYGAYTYITTGASVAAGDGLRVRTILNTSRIVATGWGLASAQAAQLTFCADTNLTGTYSVYALNSTPRGYVSTVSLTANTPACFTTNIAADTTGTWDFTSSGFATVEFGIVLACGTSEQTSTLNTWANSSAFCANTQTNMAATTGNFMSITYAKLEVAGAATPFVVPNATSELQKLQSYYRKTFPPGTAPAQAVATGALTGISQVAGTTSVIPIPWQWGSPMNINGVAITTYNPVSANANCRDVTGTAADLTVAQPTTVSTGANGQLFTCTGASGTAVGDVVRLQATADTFR